jgi:hypothetical protein
LLSGTIGEWQKFDERHTATGRLARSQNSVLVAQGASVVVNYASSKDGPGEIEHECLGAAVEGVEQLAAPPSRSSMEPGGHKTPGVEEATRKGNECI